MLFVVCVKACVYFMVQWTIGFVLVHLNVMVESGKVIWALWLTSQYSSTYKVKKRCKFYVTWRVSVTNVLVTAFLVTSSFNGNLRFQYKITSSVSLFLVLGFFSIVRYICTKRWSEHSELWKSLRLLIIIQYIEISLIHAAHVDLKYGPGKKENFQVILCLLFDKNSLMKFSCIVQPVLKIAAYKYLNLFPQDPENKCYYY